MLFLERPPSPSPFPELQLDREIPTIAHCVTWGIALTSQMVGLGATAIALATCSTLTFFLGAVTLSHSLFQVEESILQLIDPPLEKEQLRQTAHLLVDIMACTRLGVMVTALGSMAIAAPAWCLASAATVIFLEGIYVYTRRLYQLIEASYCRIERMEGRGEASREA